MVQKSQKSTQKNTAGQQRAQHLPVCSQVPYAQVTIAALTGEISAEYLYAPPAYPNRGSVSRIWSLEKALARLADGGYIFDLRPLADHPDLTTWVYRSPLPSGRINGDDIHRLSDQARQFAGEMVEAFQGDFQSLALLASQRVGEPTDGSAGPFDSVSASYLATYWASRGALVGKRAGDVIRWSDGSEQPIERSITAKEGNRE